MSDSILADLQQRLRRLEDIQAIQSLKAQYLRACDRKQPAVMRECFVEHGAVIEADGFPSIQDMHHGHNLQITFDGNDSATGLWDLDFCQINVKERTIANLSGQYTDEYQRIDGRWQIRSMRFQRGSFVLRQIDADGQEKVLALGEPPATGFIENS